jgi:hypothetical protein
MQLPILASPRAKWRGSFGPLLPLFALGTALDFEVNQLRGGAMQIIPIYDAAANADPSFKNDIQTAINILEAAFTAPITIRIDIEKGAFERHSMSFYGFTQNTALGDINENLAATISYTKLRSDLINAVPGFFNNIYLPDVGSINGHSMLSISSAEERIFGILPAITGQTPSLLSREGQNRCSYHYRCHILPDPAAAPAPPESIKEHHADLHACWRGTRPCRT